MIAAVDAFRDNPVGSVPELSDQEYGDVPPVATSVVLYAVPICPLGRDVVAMARVAGVTVKDKVTLCDCDGLPESATLNVKEALEAVWAGMPVIAPVEPFSPNPAGSTPEISVHV